MTKILKDSHGKFMKGVCTNPKGRPKGTINETTKSKLKMFQLAASDYEKAYKLLWEAMDAKEGWAFNLYFKDLLPKKFHQPTILLNTSADDPNSRVEDIVNKLKEFDEITYEEAINEVKLFKYDVPKAQEEAKVYSREELLQQLHIVKEVLEKTKEKKPKS